MAVEHQNDPILEIKDLSVAFEVDEGEVQALDGVNLEVSQGQTLGVVGESGCGKSVTALSVMRLLPKPMGKILSGNISFMGKDLLKLSPDGMREVRGNEIGMIFQEPMNALNPVKKIGVQLSEVFYSIKSWKVRRPGKAQSRCWIRSEFLPQRLAFLSTLTNCLEE